jgi:CheY-like chemotaxis protein
LTIAVIEDNEDFRELLSTLLRLRGHEVLTARDGKAGLSLLLASCPEAAFIDIDLPGLDGHTVASRARAARVDDPPYLIAMTGFGQRDDRRRSLAAGFDGHLVKPVTIEVVERALRAAPAWYRSRRIGTASS